VVGLTWIVERTFAWLSQKSSLEQRLRVEGPNFGSLHRPGGHPPHAQTLELSRKEDGAIKL
jgi:hypothetical protein